MSTFIKSNSTGDALLQEAHGLKLLREHCKGTGLQVPTVLYVDEHQLKLPRIQGVAPSDKQQACLGRGLARLHALPQRCFGLSHNNYIGLNIQKNTLTMSWGEFFYEYRLGYQVELIDSSALKRTFKQTLARVKNRLIHFLNSRCSQPSLVHGDLWSGNVMYDPEGGVWLIDPAVYFADSEVDVAMTEMFGGFGGAFYRAYESERPLSVDYPTKRAIFNLYHYLNHFNLFGESYLTGCEEGFAVLESV